MTSPPLVTSPHLASPLQYRHASGNRDFGSTQIVRDRDAGREYLPLHRTIGDSPTISPRRTFIGRFEVDGWLESNRGCSSRSADGSFNPRILGSHKSFALFRNCRDPWHGLRVHAQLPGSWETRDSAPRRGGKQLGRIRKLGGSCNHDLRRHLLLVPSHWSSHTRALDVDWPHQRDRVWRCSQLCARVQAPMNEPSPPSCTKIFPHADRVVSSPRAVVAQIRRSQIAVARTQPVEQEVLGYAEFESLGDINSQSP